MPAQELQQKDSSHKLNCDEKVDVVPMQHQYLMSVWEEEYCETMKDHRVHDETKNDHATTNDDEKGATPSYQDDEAVMVVQEDEASRRRPEKQTQQLQAYHLLLPHSATSSSLHSSH